MNAWADACIDVRSGMNIFGIDPETSRLIVLNYALFLLLVLPFFADIIFQDRMHGGVGEKLAAFYSRYLLKPLAFLGPAIFIHAGLGAEMYWGLSAAVLILQASLLFRPALFSSEKTAEDPRPAKGPTRLDIKKHNKKIEHRATIWSAWGNYLIFGCVAPPLLGILYRGDPIGLRIEILVALSLGFLIAAVLCHLQARRLLDQLKEEKAR